MIPKDGNHNEDDTVVVKRQWGDWREATYRLSDVRGIHFSTISGGVQRRFPKPMLCGYVDCNGMLEGELAHSGMHGGPCPHEIKVCIPKSRNSKKVIKKIMEKI